MSQAKDAKLVDFEVWLRLERDKLHKEKQADRPTGFHT